MRFDLDVSFSFQLVSKLYSQLYRLHVNFLAPHLHVHIIVVQKFVWLYSCGYLYVMGLMQQTCSKSSLRVCARMMAMLMRLSIGAWNPKIGGKCPEAG